MPLRRASERPIAIACFRLVTFLPERPDLSLPCSISRISVSTCRPAAGLYVRVVFFRVVFFRTAVVFLRAPLDFFRVPVDFLRPPAFLRVAAICSAPWSVIERFLPEGMRVKPGGGLGISQSVKDGAENSRLDEITPGELTERVERGDVFVVDVRRSTGRTVTRCLEDSPAASTRGRSLRAEPKRRRSSSPSRPSTTSNSSAKGALDDVRGLSRFRK